MGGPASWTRRGRYGGDNWTGLAIIDEHLLTKHGSLSWLERRWVDGGQQVGGRQSSDFTRGSRYNEWDCSIVSERVRINCGLDAPVGT